MFLNDDQSDQSKTAEDILNEELKKHRKDRRK